MGLFIPLKEEEWPSMELYAGVEFGKPYEVTDIVGAIAAKQRM